MPQWQTNLMLSVKDLILFLFKLLNKNISTELRKGAQYQLNVDFDAVVQQAIA